MKKELIEAKKELIARFDRLAHGVEPTEYPLSESTPEQIDEIEVHIEELINSLPILIWEEYEI